MIYVHSRRSGEADPRIGCLRVVGARVLKHKGHQEPQSDHQVIPDSSQGYPILQDRRRPGSVLRCFVGPSFSLVLFVFQIRAPRSRLRGVVVLGERCGSPVIQVTAEAQIELRAVSKTTILRHKMLKNKRHGGISCASPGQLPVHSSLSSDSLEYRPPPGRSTR